MGVWFSLLITVAYGLIFNSVQANTVTIAFENAFGLERTIVGALLALLVAVIIFGGIKSISRITEMIVPPMAIVYIGVAIFVVINNFSMLPSIFMEIFNGAFGLDQAIAGGIGRQSSSEFSAVYSLQKREWVVLLMRPQHLMYLTL